jgi:hypothetical protein
VEAVRDAAAHLIDVDRELSTLEGELSTLAERAAEVAEREEPETVPDVPALRNGDARPAAAAAPEPREEEPRESAASRNLPPGSPRKARLRLKSERRDEGEDAGQGAGGTRKVPAG